MNAARWLQIKTVLDAALDRPAAERPALLAFLCGDDDALRQEALSLLDAAEDDGGLDAFAERNPDPLEPGGNAGPYRLLKLLGAGGMGAVYLAERADGQFEKQVAVKLIKRGMDTDEILRRFRAERRILARLEHPHIARLLDAGMTADARPFFVLEYVGGLPINRYARERALPLRERLALFRQVCAAVQFAHQNLVIHRDLKPANILVTASGEVKLLDFGIAKLIAPEDDLTPDALTVTGAGARPYTPAYAAPEQLRGEAATTATDVYALGAVLYELLTGKRAFGPRRAPDDEPARPSAQAPALRGDLDNILQVALRVDPARRYPSAGALGDDLRRHLEKLPVRARPDTWDYRARRFVARNRIAAAAAALIGVSLVGGIVATTHQARAARAERRLAERRFAEVRALATQFLFEFHDAIRDLPGSTPARRLLAARALTSLDRLNRETGADRTLRLDLASAYLKVGDVLGRPNAPNLGDTAGALASYQKAVDLAAGAQAPEALADAWEALGNLQNRLGRRDESLELHRRAWRVREAALAAAPAAPERRRAVAGSLFAIGDALISGGHVHWSHRLAHFREAEPIYLRALALYQALQGEAPPAEEQPARDVAKTHYRLGNVYHVLGMSEGNDPARFRVGLDHHKRSVAICERLAAAHPASGQLRRNLADGLTMKAELQCMAGEPREALADCQRALPILEALAGADPENVEIRQDWAFAWRCTAGPQRAVGDLPAAAECCRRAGQILAEAAATDPGNGMPLGHLLNFARELAGLGEAMDDPAVILEGARDWVANAGKLSAAHPQDAAMRTELARGCSQMARASTRLLTAASSPAQRREARAWHARARDEWAELSRKPLAEADRGRLEEHTAAIARCDAELAAVRR